MTSLPIGQRTESAPTEQDLDDWPVVFRAEDMTLDSSDGASMNRLTVRQLAAKFDAKHKHIKTPRWDGFLWTPPVYDECSSIRKLKIGTTEPYVGYCRFVHMTTLLSNLRN